MDSLMISVVMPNLNGAKRLRQAIKSVLSQQNATFELIVVDGLSNDESHSILAEIQSQDSRLRWIKEADIGLSDAINRGVRAANGEVIAYLGSDDEYLPNIFEQITWMAQRIDFDALMFSSYTYYVREKKCVLQAPPVKEISPEALLQFGTIVGLQNTFYRARIFDEHRFDIKNKYSMDYQLLWDLVLDKKQRMFVFSNEVASINFFEGNISHNNLNQAHEAMEIAQQRIFDYKGPVWFQALISPPIKPSFSMRFKRKLKKILIDDVQN